MVTCRERTAERGACLTVCHVRIGEEYTRRGGEAVAYLARLANETVLHLDAVDYARTIAYYRVLTDYAGADIHAVVRRTHYRAVAESCHTVNLGRIAYYGVRYFFRVHNLHAVANRATVGCVQPDVFVNESAYSPFHVLVFEVFHHESGKLRIKICKKHYVAVAHLVEHRHEIALSEGCPIGGFHCAYVRNVAPLANGVVVYEVADVLYQTVVAHRNIAQCGAIDARMFEEAAAHLNIILEHSDFHCAIKHRVLHIFRYEILCHIDSRPVLCPTVVALKDFYFFLCKFPVIVRIYIHQISVILLYLPYLHTVENLRHYSPSSYCS